MENNLRIAGYCRISLDDEMDRDNVSVENQKTIIILEPSDELVEMIRKYLPHGAYQE